MLTGPRLLKARHEIHEMAMSLLITHTRDTIPVSENLARLLVS
jgi:hypothetical protein